MFSLKCLAQVAIIACAIMLNATNSYAKQIFYTKTEYVYATGVKPNVKSDTIIEKPEFLAIVNTNEKMLHTEQDVRCLAENIYHEAGAESELGKFAVAQVTINRMKNSKFPKKLCDVVFEPMQFSWTKDTEKQNKKLVGPYWEESKKVAQDVIVGGKRINGMDKALYFHEKSIYPIWAKARRKVTQIGGHIFYRAW